MNGLAFKCKIRMAQVERVMETLVTRFCVKRSDLNPSQLSRFCVQAGKTGFCLVFRKAEGSRINVSGHRTMPTPLDNHTQWSSDDR
jgi:hypothetical protein